MKSVIIALILFFTSCSCSVVPYSTMPPRKLKEECKKLCDKKHYNLEIIDFDGKILREKISIYSLTDKRFCRCKL